MESKQKIGFIGQGFIGKNYSDDFEDRGYQVVRYALEPQYAENKDKIKECNIVFIAVPTPTRGNVFDFTAVESVLELLNHETTAVIKSTLLPGTTDKLQLAFPDLYIVHSPEFLREASAKHDDSHPERNIIGISNNSEEYIKKANEVLEILPKSNFSKIMSAKEAELVKYIGNCYLYQKLVFFNQIYDLSISLGLDYENVREGAIADKRIGESHTRVVHASGHDLKNPGRGAGGHCFIKDFKAFSDLYKLNLPEDELGINVLKFLQDKNNQYLKESNKDLDLLYSVYGKE
jgi:nucleotide sugar dehydrogenase